MSNPPNLVQCPTCGCSLKSTRLEKHKVGCEKRKQKRIAKHNRHLAIMRKQLRYQQFRQRQKNKSQTFKTISYGVSMQCGQGTINETSARKVFDSKTTRKQTHKLQDVMTTTRIGSQCRFCGKASIPGESICFDCMNGRE